MRQNDHDRRVLVMAPVGQDARAIAQLLTNRGLSATICNGAADCCAEINAGAGALLLTEEALEMERGLDVVNTLKMQPAWSELPLIILTTGGETRLNRLLELAAEAAGTLTLLERPLSSMTLLRSVEVALNSRRRQFQLRDLLEEQRRAQRELRDAHEQLADRAQQLEVLVQERTASLVESNEQLRREISERERAEASREALRRQLLNAQEEERRRIARELHDQMGQNLTVLNLSLKSLHDAAPKKFRGAVVPLQELAAHTARDLHRVALELRPSTLDDLGLVKAIGNLVEKWSTQWAIDVDIECSQYNPSEVSKEAETALYRIIQEALNNVAKHSRARRVSIILQGTAGYVQAIIEDDGRGFDTAKPRPRADQRGGLGLSGIRERLNVLGGSLSIESAPGRGTALIVRIPALKTT
ncbi:MAG TPA: sensor histidine kinase [Candidatus Udaeobacter sp.]|nr:sensor histidine kinase [Candidatus Udaeobacter sp.]